MSARDALVYSGAAGRLVLGPVAARGLRTQQATGTTPRRAYSAMRKLYGASPPRFARLAASAADPHLLDLPAEPAGLAAGAVDATVDALRRDGFVVLDRRLDEDTCAELEAVARSVPCTLVDGDREGRATYDEAAPIAVRYEVEEADLVDVGAVQRLLADESLLAVAQRYLGAAPVQDLITMWWSVARGGPASARAAQQFHFDLDRLAFVKVFVYLTDVDDAHGPHVYVRGSHRAKPAALRRDGRHGDAAVAAAFGGDEQRIVGPRGTVFLADTIGLHKGTALETGHRLVFQTEYATSLFGSPYGRPAIAALSEELAAAVARHPGVYRRFRLPA